jgi:hypothetical protein
MLNDCLYQSAFAMRVIVCVKRRFRRAVANRLYRKAEAVISVQLTRNI